MRSIRTRWAAGLGAAALVLAAAACGDNPAAPADSGVVEDISAAEIAAAGDLAGLTDAERAQVRAILEDAHQSLMALRDQLRAGEIDREEARTRARAIHDQAIAALSEILNENQIQELFQRLRHHPDRPMLNLTDEQRAALEAIRDTFHTFAADLRDQVRAGEITAEEARSQLRDAFEQMRADACAVLTEDQAAEAPFCNGAGGPGPGGASGPGPGPGGGPGFGPGGGPPGDQG